MTGLLTCICGLATAQTPARRAETQAIQSLHYREAKAQLDQGQYAAALVQLEPLATPATHFARAADAAYLAAYAAARLGQWAEAEQLINLLRAEYPAYPNLPDALLLQGQLSLELKDYDTAVKNLAALPPGRLATERDALLTSYLPRLTDRTVWQRLLRRYPQNDLLAHLYANRLVAPNSFFTEADRPALEALVARLHLDAARYTPPAVAPALRARKSSYNVAVLLPFELDDTSWQTQRKNQFVTDLYAGLRLAQDSLARAGHPLQLYCYDTGAAADTATFRRLLALPEMAGIDLFIGPIYKTNAKLLSRFALEHQTVCVNPISQDGDLALDNPYQYLFLPSAATQGRQAAQFAASAFGLGRPAWLAFEDSKDDADFANAYQATFEALGGKVLPPRRFNPDLEASLSAAFAGLATAGAGHVVVASDARRSGPAAFAALRSTAPRPALLAPASWLDNPRLEPEQFNGNATYLLQPKFYDEAGPNFRRFRQLYLGRQHLPPSLFACQGFELLLQFGSVLHQFGPGFQTSLSTAGPLPGFLFHGINYPTGFRDNQIMPITKLDNLQLQVVR